MIGVCTLGDPETRTLFLDSHICGKLPRRKELIGATFYADTSVLSADLEKRMRPGDIAYGPSPGKISTLQVSIGTGAYYIVAGSSWGVDSGSVDYQHAELAKIYRELRPLRAWRRTAAGTARAVASAVCPPDVRGLAPMARGLAHEAVHGGPAVCVAGGGERVAQVDMVQAYAQGMVGYLPQEWIPVKADDWDIVGHSIVEAIVRVGPGYVGSIPPLPTQDGRGTQIRYSTGRIRGVWTSEHLRQAMDLGWVESVAPIQAVSGVKPSNWLEQAIRWAKSVMPQWAYKKVYTRLYGILCGRGGWECRFLPDAGDGDKPEWISREIDPEGAAPHKLYRPDLAAIITGRTHAELFRGLSGLRREGTVAVHVDAIWTKDISGAARLVANHPSKWALKGVGRVRFYAPGMYSENAEPDRASELPPPDDGARVWVDTTSWESMDAVSVPPVANRDVRRPIVAHRSVYDKW